MTAKKPLMKDKMHLTEPEKETLDWLKTAGWYNWGSEYYFSDVFAHELPDRLEKTQKQMDAILTSLKFKQLVVLWEAEYDERTEDGFQAYVGYIVGPTWRTYDYYGELDKEHIKYEFGGQDPRENDDMQPLTHEMMVSPFMKQFTEELHAIQKGEPVLNVNGNPMGGAMWNLIISHRDLSLWTGYNSRTGEFLEGGPHIVPNANWSVKETKAYFGLTGTSTYDPENPQENVMHSFLRLYNWINPSR